MNMYTKLQNLWLKDTGIKVGDCVKVVGKAKANQLGWEMCWIGEMDKAIDTLCTVLSIHDEEGLCLAAYLGKEAPFNSCYFPFFVLEKADEPAVTIKDDYDRGIVVTGKAVAIGSYSISRSVALKVADAIYDKMK